VNLITWELIKIFKQKTLFVSAIFIFGLLTFDVFTAGYETVITQKAYKEWEGPLTEEKVQKAEKVNAELNEYFSKEPPPPPDEFKFAQLGAIENVAYGNNINITLLEKRKDIEKLIVEAKSQNDNALVNKLKLQRDMYNEIHIDKITYFQGPQQIVDFVNTYGLVLTAVFLLVGLAGIYSNEHSSGVENYILSTKNGRKKTMMAKLAASSIFGIVAVLFWEAFNLFANTVKYGPKGWDIPLQYSFKYYFSPYNFTFMEYHMIQIGLHVLGAVAFAAVIVLISTVAKSTMISFFVSGSLFAIPILLESMMNMQLQWVTDMLRYTLTNIMKVEGLFMDFFSVNLLGQPILAPFIGLAISVIILLLSTVLARYIIVKKQVV
jgi:hypothetical protein